MPWQTASVRIAGRSHFDRGEECDDAVSVRREDNRLVVVLSDGAGSAARGGEAARMLVDRLSADLVAILLDGSSISRDAQRIAVCAREAIGRIRQDLIALGVDGDPAVAEPPRTLVESNAGAVPPPLVANRDERALSSGEPSFMWQRILNRGADRPRSPQARPDAETTSAGAFPTAPRRPFPGTPSEAVSTHPLACTLVAAIADPTGAMTLHLGDGYMEMLGAGPDPQDPLRDVLVRWQSLPENGQYSNETFFLVDEDWQKHLRISGPVTGVRIILAMTDGAAPFALALGQRGLHQPLFRPLARWLVTFGPGNASESLAAVLTEEKVRRVSDDDATLVWAYRFSDEEQDVRP